MLASFTRTLSSLLVLFSVNSPVHSPVVPASFARVQAKGSAWQDVRGATALLPARNPLPHLTVSRRSSEPFVAGTFQFQNADDVPLSQVLYLTLQSDRAFPAEGAIEVETTAGGPPTVISLRKDDGLVLQDFRTIRLRIDLVHAPGNRLLGPLRFRVVSPSPLAPAIHAEHETPVQVEVDSAGRETVRVHPAPPVDASGDWQPLATLVRLPALHRLVCPAGNRRPCRLSGSNLFLIDSVSADPAFTHPVVVSGSFAGSSLTVPHTRNGRLYLKLRDDPAFVDTAIVPER